MTSITELATNCDYDALEALGFYGTDASLEISMSEYQLAIKRCISAVDGLPNDNYIALYKNSQNEWECNQETEECFMEPFFESWFEKDSFLSFVGSVEADWLSLPLIVKLGDMISFYGTQNILGCY
jgi:hypothetical protein